MKNSAYIAGILLLFATITSCHNMGRTDMLPQDKPENTAYLKNTALPLAESTLKASAEEVQSFYALHNNTTVWTDAKNRIALQNEIANLEADGLTPNDYNLGYLKDFEKLQSITEDEARRYDIMLTEAFIKATTHLFKGKLRPADVYANWALPDKPFDAVKLLTEALENNNINDAINRCRPRHAIYQSLRSSLANLNELPSDKDLPKIAWTATIKKKDSSATVGIVKQRLQYWGDLKTDSITNTYDKATAKAVRRFQRRHGLSITGTVNQRTATALNISRDKRREQVIANLERWRWFAYDFGNKALLINIPDYKMAVVENGKDTVQTYNVVVGKPERATPVLQSAINAVVLNPTWTVPPTIIKEDLTPAATKNRDYFASHNMTIYKDTNIISAEDWNPAKYNNYRYVQAPGYNNSLGLVKFNFNSKYSVYLHDTNHRDLFAYHYRALSSGCVRVEDPLKLAEYVLGNQNKKWTRSEIDQVTTEGETKNVYIKKSIQVHQLYWTAWMDKDGLQFRDDIYSLDKTLYKKLRQDL